MQGRALLLAQAGFALQQCGVAEHGVQRRAKLVAHRREELGLGARRLLGQQLRCAQRLFGNLALGDLVVDADQADDAPRLSRKGTLVVNSQASLPERE
jgi:hypothetical protein